MREKRDELWGLKKTLIQKFTSIGAIYFIAGLSFSLPVGASTSYTLTLLTPPPTNSNDTYYQYRDFNDEGQVVGTIYKYWTALTSDGYEASCSKEHGFMYDVASKVYKTIDNPNAINLNNYGICFDFPGSGLISGPFTNATAINNNGLVSGTFIGDSSLDEYGNSNGATSGFVYDPSNNSYTTLEYIKNDPSIPNSSGFSGFLGTVLWDLNENKQIAGWFTSSEDDSVCFVYDIPGKTYTTIPNCKQLLSINNTGQVIGHTPDSSLFPFVYDINTNARIYNAPDGYSLQSINDKGQVLGYILDSMKYFIYDLSSNTYTYPVSSFPQGIRQYKNYIYKINNKGQLFGEFDDEIGAHYYIATPVPGPATLVDPTPDFLSGPQITKAITQDQGQPYLADLSKGREVDGLATDGVAQVIIRIPASQAREVFDVGIRTDQCSDPTTPDCIDDYGFIFDPSLPPSSASLFSNTPDINKATTSVTAVDTDQGPMAFAAYRAPMDFVRSGVANSDDQEAQRSVFVDITSRATNLPQSLEVLLVRPPVVLVHGLWASAQAGDLLAVGSSLLNNSLFHAEASDYGSVTVPIFNSRPYSTSTATGSSLGVDFGVGFTDQFTSDMLDRFKDSNNPIDSPIAVIQADFVAHSMGALVTRSLQHLSSFRADINYTQGYIHKVVSIGGPHLGSPVALKLTQDSNKNECTIRSIGLFGLGYPVITEYGLSPSECRKPSDRSCHSGAIADLAGKGDGKSLSKALKLLYRTGSLPVAYVTGHMSQQAIDAISAYPYPPGSGAPMGYSYTSSEDNQVYLRDWEFLDVIRGCSGTLPPLLTTEKFPEFEPDPDGVVPLNSQHNGVNPFVDLTSITGGVVHSGGIRTLGFGATGELLSSVTLGIIDQAPVKTLLDEEAATAVLKLLNTSVRNSIYIPRQ